METIDRPKGGKVGVRDPKKSKKGSKKKGFYVWLHWKIKAHEAAKRDRDPMKGRPENIFAPSIMNGGDGRHHVHFVVMQM